MIKKSKLGKRFQYFKRIISISIIIAFKKVIYKLFKSYKNKKQYKYDKINCTYLDYLIKRIELQSFFEITNIKLLENKRDDIIKLADNFLKHKFNCLGTECLSVNIKEISYQNINNDDKIQNLKENLLNNRINKSNREESRKILNLIEQPYEFIDWSRDFKSDFSWNPQQWSKSIKYGEGKGDDIKIPWELGRMQHLPLLAIAELIKDKIEDNTNRGVYFKEFQNLLIDFIASNPPRYGVQWISSMDCSIRIINWLITYDLFRSNGFIMKEAIEKVFKRSIIEHGLHIYNNPEWSSGLRGNHYLTNLSGMIFISSYFYNAKTSKLLDYGLKSLIRELDYQFNNDGSYFEASTAYHCLAVEIIIWTTTIILQIYEKLNLTKNQTLLRDKILKLLEKKLPNIMDFTDNILGEQGNLIQIGDNDSGRIIKLNAELFV